MLGCPLSFGCYHVPQQHDTGISDAGIAKETCPLSKACNLFVVEVIKAWINPAMKNPRAIHHLGCSNFMVAGEKIKLKSIMKQHPPIHIN